MALMRELLRAGPVCRLVGRGGRSAGSSGLTRWRWCLMRAVRSRRWPAAWGSGRRTWVPEAAQVSRQAFYDWRRRHAAGPTGRELAEADLVAEICRVHGASGAALGPLGDRRASRRGPSCEPQAGGTAHESPPHCGDPSAAPQAHHHPRPHRAEAAGPAVPGLRARCPGSCVGRGHHLCAHRAGLAVPGGRARSGIEAAVGLPDERPDRHTARPRRPRHGRRCPHRPHLTPPQSRCCDHRLNPANTRLEISRNRSPAGASPSPWAQWDPQRTTPPPKRSALSSESSSAGTATPTGQRAMCRDPNTAACYRANRTTTSGTLLATKRAQVPSRPGPRTTSP